MTPPGLARWLLARLLPQGLREPVMGDLDEVYAARLASGWPRRRASAEYWRLACRSIADAAGRDDGAPLAGAGDPTMMSVAEDVRYALRLLGRSPAFALSALLTMALGIGVTTAVFSLADVLLFRPLPYESPGRLVFLLGWDTARDEMRFNVPHADVQALRGAGPLEQVAAYQYWNAALSGREIPERLQGYKVSANTFDMLGVPAALGRAFSASDRPEDAGVVVISDALWRRVFGADPAIVGRRVLLNDEPRVIVGVMPRAFEFPVFNFKGDLWVPFGLAESDEGSVVALGRLAPGRTLAEAQAAADGITTRLAETLPDSHRNRGVRLREMRELGAAEARPAVIALLVAVGLLLLLACANVAELLIARGAVRQHELATRLALGAGRGRIVRQLLTESLVIAVLGSALGIVAAGWALDVLRAMLPEAVLSTLPGIAALGVDARTLVVAIGVTMVAGLLAGIAPAWRGVRSQGLERLGAAGRSAGGRGDARVRAALIVSEVALSFALLATGGLLLQGVGRLLATDPGFRVDHLLTFSVALPDTRYDEPGARRAFVDLAVERLGVLPGVESVAAVNTLPFSTYNQGTRIALDGGLTDHEDAPAANLRTATPGYFQTLGIPLDAGRAFVVADRAGGEPVAIVNRMFVRRYLGGEPPERHKVRLGGEDEPWRRIVGTVGDVRHDSLGQPAEPEVYVPLAQAPPRQVMFAVRTGGDPADFIFPVRRGLAQVDGSLPAFHVRPMEDAVRVSAVAQVLTLRLMTGFGLLALLLAAFGVHAVVSQAVSQRGREMAVRVALGASPADLARHVLGSAIGPMLAGLLLGGLAAAGLGALLGGLVPGMQPSDPGIFGLAGAALAAMVLVAAAGPTWRAMRTDTAVTLKAE